MSASPANWSSRPGIRRSIVNNNSVRASMSLNRSAAFSMRRVYAALRPLVGRGWLVSACWSPPVDPSKSERCPRGKSCFFERLRGTQKTSKNRRRLRSRRRNCRARVHEGIGEGMLSNRYRRKPAFMRVVDPYRNPTVSAMLLGNIVKCFAISPVSHSERPGFFVSFDFAI